MCSPLKRKKMIAGSSVAAFVAAALCLAPSQAEAASCSIGTVVGVALGGYDVFSSSPLDSAGSVTFSCTGVGANDVIYINLSRGGSSTFFPRRMTSGGSALEYNLFLDAARTQVWGDGTGGSSHYGPVKPPEGTNTSLTVYGRAPARQNISVGTYADPIVVTILY